MSELRLISIVTCFFNEGNGVDGYFASLRSVLDTQHAATFEFICVDDGSTDDTLQKLLAHQAVDERIRVIELSRNFGKEAALTAGVDAAEGDAVIPIDADLQDPPELIPEMIDRWLQGAEMVVAHRSDRHADSLLKRGSAALFYRIHNVLSPVSIPEDVGDFRLIDRRVVEALKQFPERQRFMKGLFAWVGFRSVAIDYVRRPRQSGRTKFSPWRLWNLALEGVTGFTTAPLRVWTYVGMAGALVAATYALFIVTRTLILGIDVPGYASLLVAILFMGSLQLVSIGLLGEYIGRIYSEAKHRPIYIVRRRHDGKRSAT